MCKKLKEFLETELENRQSAGGDETDYVTEAREALDELATLTAERDALKAALEWYEKHVGNCRKNTSEGDASRRELDRDCGTNARAALGALTTVKPEITTTSAK